MCGEKSDIRPGDVFYYGVHEVEEWHHERQTGPRLCGYSEYIRKNDRLWLNIAKDTNKTHICNISDDNVDEQVCVSYIPRA
jgi:aromatic ring-opening dioxygenase LigB subunit